MEVLDHEHEHHHEHHHEHGHYHHHHHHHSGDAVNDYAAAVAEYRKSFPSAADVLALTPDPAVREMLVAMQENGLETVFDRFDRQKPQCTFGIAGVCCKNCTMGPCKVTKKAPKGVCGAGADTIVARNLLRHIAAAVSGHGARGRETILALKYAAQGRVDLEIAGEEKILKTAATYGLDTEGKTPRELAGEIADILLDDLSRTVPAPHRTLLAFAPPERIETWKKHDLLPVSAYHEVFEAMHRTGTGTDADPDNLLTQFERCGVAFAWSSVLGSSIASDCLYGLPVRNTLKANVGALKKGYVNIAVHGHSPLLVREIVRQGGEQRWIEAAREAGAEGIRFYGICCSGLSAMYRYGNVIPLSNAVGAELVLGTGAIDLWVADVQDVFPSIMEVAACFRTTVVTTSDSARLQGAEHYGLAHDHSNLGEIEAIASKILQRAMESHADRRDVPVKIPAYEVDAEIGFSLEAITAYYGGIAPLADALREGTVKGVVNLVGCNNPRVIYEKAVVDICEELIKNDILVLTNGCASFPLLKLGYCNKNALKLAGPGLRRFLRDDLPPVWHLGECLDNARASAIFRALSNELGVPIKALPVAFASPEWSNEKGIGAALSFRLLGINSYHCVHLPIQGSDRVMEYLLDKSAEKLGSKAVVEVDHLKLAQRIIDDLSKVGKLLIHFN
ncbi:MAG: anaerobic carbon-monoxide dehydrogenase catalytic subunit [Rikenellaceae bacterium]|jgi:carbon-monoxide dehydrogenase catalytic subunit|nr:anaerobic carbon-monoxide dehydrogenase catalytic subunit [Rikenellaceae bacterium]